MKFPFSRPSLLELTLLAVIGVAAAIRAVPRDKEQAWYLGIVTAGLNAVAWWYAVSHLSWGYLYES